MKDDAQYSGDVEDEWKISTNGSEFAQSIWSYENLSATTEQWDEDVFMGSARDHTLRHGDTSDDFSRLEGLVDPSSSRNFSSYPPINTPLAGLMSPALATGRVCPDFHDEILASGSGLSEAYINASASPHHLGTRPTSNEPWNLVGHPRVLAYDSGYVAFVDSPRSSSDQSFCEVPSGPNVSLQESITYASQHTGLENASFESTVIANQQQLRWEVISAATYGPLRNNSTTWRDNDRGKRKGRRGPLDTQRAKDAYIMRKIGVCWPCRVLKVKCSPGHTCETCRHHMSPLAYQVCSRSGFADFEVLYFPRVLISHFDKKEVKSFVARNVESFIGPEKVVRVHCGRSFIPMELTVHFFRHKTDTLLNHHFASPGKERTLKMVIKRCAPVGIMGADIDDLKRECMSCIKSMVSHPEYTRQVTAGEKSGIYRRALEIIHRYSKVEKNCLLDNAMQLHAMHYFMTRILTFTKDSASMVKRVSRNDLGLHLPSDVISSRLLNRQIKYAMHILHRRQTKTVLQEFERHLKKREQTGWPISFGVVLILCLCMEDIQIAANNFVFSDVEISPGLRNESYQACWQLEDKPYRQCTQLFHDMYRSYKQPNGHASEGGFNPIAQDGCQSSNWSQATQDMVYGIRQIIADSKAEMRALSTVSVFNDQDQSGHHNLMEDHPARLLSKFLLSFLDGT